jgi:hypothetical protein
MDARTDLERKVDVLGRAVVVLVAIVGQLNEELAKDHHTPLGRRNIQTELDEDLQTVVTRLTEFWPLGPE